MLKLVGKIKVITGLHIGKGKNSIGIGEIDASVIRDRNGYPYIPGSSLKGKIRSLLAHHFKSIGETEDSKIENETHEMKKAFGIAFVKKEDSKKEKEEKEKTEEKKKILGAGQVIFRDAFLCQEDRERFKGENQKKLYEEKMETAIDRYTGTALGKALRTIERVHPDVNFDLEIILKNEKHKELIEKGLKLLENSYLGGMGTRGYGQIKIEVVPKNRKEESINLKETA